MHQNHSPSIRSRYDYFYNMSPSSTNTTATAATSFHDNQHASLFGEPVPPPPTGFLDNFDTHLYGSLRRGSSAVSSNYLTAGTYAHPMAGVSGSRKGSDGFYPYVSDGYGMQTGLGTGLIGGARRGSAYSEYSVPRTRSAVANDFRTALDNYQLQVESSPRRGSSSEAFGRTLDWRMSIDEWSNTIPRPRSGNSQSLSRTASDRSPNLVRSSSSSLNRSRKFQEVTPLPDSKSISPASFRDDVPVPNDERQRKASAVRRSREPSPVIVTDFINTGFRLPDTRTTNKKPSFSILNEKKAESLEEHRGGSRSSSPLKGQTSSTPIPIQGPASEISQRSARRTSFDNGEGQNMERYQITTDERYKTMIQISDMEPMTSSPPKQEPKNRSHETLSNIVRNETGLTASMKELQRSGSMKRRKSTVPPIKMSKAVVHIVSDQKAPDTPSKIPRRQSLTGKDAETKKGSASISRTPSRKSGRRRSSVISVIEDKKPKPVNQKQEKSSSRQSLLKPTTLSPIIGTPNKQSEASSIPGSEKEGTVPDSPSKIPVRSRSGSVQGSRSNSRLNNQSREPSPTKHSAKERIKPNFLAPTRATSFRTRTPINMTSNLSRPKLGPPVFGSLRKPAPAKKKSPKPARKVLKKTSSDRSFDSTSGKRITSPIKTSPTKKPKSSSESSKEILSPEKKISKGSKDSKDSKDSKESKESTKSKDNKTEVKASEEAANDDEVDEEHEEETKMDHELTPDTETKDKASDKSDDRSIKSMASATSIRSVTLAGKKFKKLIPMTKPNVVSMTTAAVVSQPAQIQATLTNQLSQSKIVDPNKEIREGSPDPMMIIDKSTKTLENIQKTVSEVTEEITKTIEEKISELKEMEHAIANDVPVHVSPDKNEKNDKTEKKMLQKEGKSSSSKDLVKVKADSEMKPVKEATPSQPLGVKVNTVENKPSDSVSANKSAGEMPGSVSVPAPAASSSTTTTTAVSSSKPVPKPAKSEALELESGNTNAPTTGTVKSSITTAPAPTQGVQVEQSKRAGEGVSGSGAGGGGAIGQSQGVGQSAKTQPAMTMKPIPDKNNNNMATLEARNGNQNKGSMPEGSSSSPSVAPKGPPPHHPPPPPASLTTINEKKRQSNCCKVSECCDPCCTKLCCCIKWPDWCLKKSPSMEMVNEKRSCWDKMCCASKKSLPEQIQTISGSSNEPFEPETPGCCQSCLERFLCCKPKNKISSKRGSNALSYEYEKKKCCFCIPYQKKRRRSDAWSDSQHISHISGNTPTSCCSRFWQTLCCCFCRKKKSEPDTRRTSLNSKKPPTDDKEKKKLDHCLVEHNSMMKAAIPAMHVCLAWFCLICNILIPGLGTILSGWFCICFGKPRFSPIDGAKPRIGSLVINMIVGVAQAFCVIFCLVGWGWSIWWGMIMLKTAKKYKKIRKAEEITAAVNAGKAIELPKKKRRAKAAAKAHKNKDVEAGIT